jgi:hypothetical protein
MTNSKRERRLTGITARQQRQRRTGQTHPEKFGTERGVRKYLRVLRSLAALRFVQASRTPAVQKQMIVIMRIMHRNLPKHMVCFKPANRSMRRWIDQYWSAEGQVR